MSLGGNMFVNLLIQVQKCKFQTAIYKANMEVTYTSYSHEKGASPSSGPTGALPSIP